MTIKNKKMLLINESMISKFTIGGLKAPNSPLFYSKGSIKIQPALDFLKEYNRTQRKPVTITHLVIKAIGIVIKNNPDLNRSVRFYRTYRRQSIRISSLILAEDKTVNETVPFYIGIDEPQDLSLSQLAEQFESKTKEVREEKNKVWKRSKTVFRYTPFFLLGFIVSFTRFLHVILDLDLKWLMGDKNYFGHITVNNVIAFGGDESYSPIVPFTGISGMINLCKIQNRFVETQDGSSKFEKYLVMCGSYDHRVFDGLKNALLFQQFRKIMENPTKHFEDQQINGYTKSSR